MFLYLIFEDGSNVLNKTCINILLAHESQNPHIYLEDKIKQYILS